MRKIIIAFTILFSIKSSAVELDVFNVDLNRFASIISEFLDKPVLVDVNKANDKVISFSARINQDDIKPFLEDYLLSQDLHFYERDYFYYIDDESFSSIQYQNSMVKVQAIIVETHLLDTRSFDIDFQSSGLSFTSQRDISSGLTVSQVTGGYSLLVDFLKSNSNTEILSNPNLTLEHSKMGRIQVGQNVPILKSVQTSNEGGAQSQQVQRLDIGLVLDITANFLTDHTVSLDIVNEVSTLSDSNLASDIIINKKQISTSAIVKDSELLHVGGLIDKSTVTSENITPFFGEIPLIGGIFNSQHENTTTTRLDVFLKIDIVK